MPDGFDVPRAAEFWAPIMPVLAGSATTWSPRRSQNTINNVGVFYLVGRVRPGLSADEIARQVDALDARLQRDVPGRPKWGDRAVVVPLLEYVFGPVRPALWALWAAVTVLLLIACANVSGLMLDARDPSPARPGRASRHWRNARIHRPRVDDRDPRAVGSRGRVSGSSPRLISAAPSARSRRTMCPAFRASPSMVSSPRSRSRPLSLSRP